MTSTNFATTVPTKGSMGRFVVDKVIDMIDEVGDAKQTLTLKTDKEPSVKALIEDIFADREEGRTVTEESPVGSSGSSGVVERAV